MQNQAVGTGRVLVGVLGGSREELASELSIKNEGRNGSIGEESSRSQTGRWKNQRNLAWREGFSEP